MPPSDIQPAHPSSWPPPWRTPRAPSVVPSPTLAHPIPASRRRPCRIPSPVLHHRRDSRDSRCSAPAPQRLVARQLLPGPSERYRPTAAGVLISGALVSGFLAYNTLFLPNLASSSTPQLSVRRILAIGMPGGDEQKKRSRGVTISGSRRCMHFQASEVTNTLIGGEDYEAMHVLEVQRLKC